MMVFAIILPMTITQITDVEKLAKENEELRQFLLERDQKINYLEEQLTWLKRQIFGKRSEKIISDLSSEQLQFDGFVPPRLERHPNAVSPCP